MDLVNYDVYDVTTLTLGSKKGGMPMMSPKVVCAGPCIA